MCAFLVFPLHITLCHPQFNPLSAEVGIALTSVTFAYGFIVEGMYDPCTININVHAS